MTEDKFIRIHSDTWKQLEQIVSLYKNRKNSKPDFKTLKDFDRLYRQVSGHLAYAQTYFPRSQTCEYLNTIVANAHNAFYNSSRKKLNNISEFYIKELPVALAKNSKVILISFLIFTAGFIFSFAFTWLNSKNAHVFLPDNFIQNINFDNKGAEGWNHPVMSGLIITNNVRVALLCFAYGISLGIGTIYVLIANGFVLGSLSALVMQHGDSFIYWSRILPHGIIELTAIFISGAAGLKIGYGFIRPGLYRRVDALVIAGREALILMGAVVPMLLIAGVIEGFLTPSELSPQVKILFAAFTGLVMILYFLTGYLKKSN